MRDLGDGSGTFVRLDVPLVLKSGYIASFGDSHMTVNFFQGESAQANGPRHNQRHGRSQDRIQLKFIDGPKTD